MLWKVFFSLALISVVAAGFWQSPVPYTQPPLDKLAHALAFAVLTFLMLRATSWRIYWVLALSLLLGLMIELGQEWFLPRRTFSWYDLGADVIGLLVAGISEWIWRYWKSVKTV